MPSIVSRSDSPEPTKRQCAGNWLIRDARQACAVASGLLRKAASWISGAGPCPRLIVCGDSSFALLMTAVQSSNAFLTGNAPPVSWKLSRSVLCVSSSSSLRAAHALSTQPQGWCSALLIAGVASGV